MDIVLATRNKKKADEIKKILLDIQMPIDNVFTLDDFPQCPDVREDGRTFKENAVKKAVVISKSTGMTSFADDSGLEVNALKGAPGIFSARYAGKSANDTANLKKLLHKMEKIHYEKRSARFVCCIAMADQDIVKTFTGYVEGRIGTEPRGANGFGYDPVFYPAGHDRTFAEMSDEEKNSLSHRGKALRELQKYLLSRMKK
jgi:XTP/dITP diphosphohydrolase